MGKTYYVSAETGNDSNDGLSEKAAFKSLQAGADRLKAGDTLYIMNGTYTQSDPKKDLMVIENKNGSQDNWITIKAYPGHTPKLKVKGSDGINVAGSSYIRIQGLDLEGSKDEVTLDYAKQEQYNPNNPITNSSGIYISPSYSGFEQEKGYSHHIVISENKVRNFTATGIGAEKADYVTIEKNIVSGNSWYSPLGTSGIGVIYNRNTDNNTNDYKFIIKDNVVYDNQNLIPWMVTGKIAEGNGIILDSTDGKNSHDKYITEVYTGKTLVADNIVYNNGSSGISAYRYSNVDIVNNTTYENARNTDPGGEIAVGKANNVRVYNNIMYARPDRRANSLFESENVVFDHNVVYNYDDYYEFKASDDPNAGELQNLLGYDPQFVNPSQGDFTLKSTSPAIDVGSSIFNGVSTLKTDQRGNNRPQDGDGNGSAIADIGALEVGTNSASVQSSDQTLPQGSDNQVSGDLENDILTGEPSGDGSIYIGNNQQQGFSQSQDGVDPITNSNPNQGDRIWLNNDGTLSTSTNEGNQTIYIYDAGLVKGNNLSAAIQSAYKDKDPQTQGDQLLNSNEGVLFEWQGSTYLAINDQNQPFDSNSDFLINMNSIHIPGKDTVTGVV
ncbi:MAG: right-handed parallel beta-helix repeat-containing protein [Fischerella sp. CENA71]|nr:right-handed parallel beta-helix repeat-containing protein [Fischerella sp. CENA71]